MPGSDGQGGVADGSCHLNGEAGSLQALEKRSGIPVLVSPAGYDCGRQLHRISHQEHLQSCSRACCNYTS